MPNSNSNKVLDESRMITNYAFNQKVARKELTTMIGFKRFISCLQPLFKLVFHKTIKNDILKIYDYEKSKTMTILAKLQS